MGKRELLLAAVFIVVGFGVYQATKPPADPSRRTSSLSSFFNEIRREIRGNNATAEGTFTTRVPVPGTVKEFRVALGSGTLTVAGEDRTDIEAQLHVTSNGSDAEEAARLVKAVRVRADPAGELLILHVDFPREGRQTANLSLKVPARLGFRLDNKSGVLKISHVNSVTIGTLRGQTTITDVAGNVSLQQRGGELALERVSAARVQATGVEARVSDIRADANFVLQGGEFEASRLAGALQLEALNTDVRLEQLEGLHGAARMNITRGELHVTGLKTDARIDARDAEVTVEPAAPAPLAIYNTNEGTVELVMPAAGYTFDLASTAASISIDEALQKLGLAVITHNTAPGPSESPRESRASGAVRGGGPAVVVRTGRGGITVRTR